MTDDAERQETSPAIALPSDGAPLRAEADPDLDALRERVGRAYGDFGERPSTVARDEARVLADTDWRNTAWIVAGVFLASALLALASRPTWEGGGWASSFRLDTAAVVIWAPLLYVTMARQRVWRSVRTYLVLALFIEAFSETMFVAQGEGGYWDSVLWPAAVAFFGTLKELSGLPGASLSAFFFVTVGLLYRAARAKRARVDPPPAFARNALLLFLGAVLALAALGLARGGQIEWTFRQTIHLLQLPLVGLVFLYALRVPEDLAAVGATYVVVAIARSLLVIYVYVGVCIPEGIAALPGKPEWCTTHSDSVLFVSALVVLGARALELRRRRVVVEAIGFGAVILLAIVLNNRRLAFVSLAVASLVIYLALDPSRRKRRVTIALAVLVPLLVAYVLVGSESTSTSPLLKPAKSIASVLDQQDTSSLSRDVENENLIYTLRKSPVVTSGFGHEYEYSPANPPVDLTDVFKNFRLIAHNGVLWLWSIGGVLGFTLLWLVYPLAGTLAVRGYRSAGSALERAAGLSSLGCVAICVVQIWGDQGFSSYLTMVTFGVAFAVASRLAVRGS
jgi:hypothetical protein